ncbi:MAG: hypothetical protein ACXAC7_17005 [Candidatus Hodarchaeales archaeon]|jgi:hypothetical protein
MTFAPEINLDQLKIVHLLKDPKQAYPNTSAEVGVTYERITEVTNLSVEKVLLSLGWLESIGVVEHDVGIERKMITYLGRSDTITHPGQRPVRLFFLSDKGKEIAKNLPPLPTEK